MVDKFTLLTEYAQLELFSFLIWPVNIMYDSIVTEEKCLVR